MKKRFYLIEYKKLQNGIIEIQTSINELFNNFNNKSNIIDFLEQKINECLEYIFKLPEKTLYFIQSESGYEYASLSNVIEELKDGEAYLETRILTTIYNNVNIIYSYIQNLSTQTTKNSKEIIDKTLTLFLESLKFKTV